MSLQPDATRLAFRKARWIFALALAAFLYSPSVYADVIRLNSGSVIDGQIIRDDDTAIVIVVNGSPQFYPADDVSAIIYSHIRIDPRSAKRSRFGVEASRQALLDTSVIAKIRERMLTYHGFVMRLGTVAEYLRWGDTARAGVAAQRAARWILPFHHGGFSPFSALADVLVLLGLRAPVLWLALAFVRESRAITRIAEFLVPAYGLLMLLMVYITITPWLAIQLALFPLAVCGVGSLFIWMFALTRGRALLAFSIAVAMNVLVEYLLVQSHWLSAGLQNPLLQIAQR